MKCLNFKKKYFFSLIIFIIIINISLQITSRNLPIKRILILLIPGGHSHNIVAQNLLDYTITHEIEFKYEYHIISHNIDSKIWENKIKLENNNNSYKLYTYGDIFAYESTIESAIDEMETNPIFGFFGFNKAMILNIKQFMESNILTKLKLLQKEHQKKYNEDFFSMIITDIPNFIHKLIYTELNIKLNIYLEPAFVFQIFYPNFELNTAYTPMIGTIFSDEMTFSERLKNSFIFTFTKILFKIFQMNQNQIINSYGYDIDNNIHIYDSLHIIQYPLGLCFPLSLPPNFILISSITSNRAEKIKDNNIDNFLEKYKKNIYISKGTLSKLILGKEDIILTFKKLEKENIGIVLSIREEILSDNEIKNFPMNVYLSRWVEQNNILGDSRINLFITHGGFNSVMESIYHGKPMIILGINLDHINIASFVKKRRVGEVFQNKNLINNESLLLAINKVINSKEYINNAKNIGKIIQNMKNPREEFQYWIDHGLKFGYQHLEIPAYKYKYSWIIINGYDIFFIWVIIFFILYETIKRIYNCMHDCLCGKCENKHKIKKKNIHYKFD